MTLLQLWLTLLLAALLWPCPARAETIADCLLQSPNDHDVLAIQVPATGNAIVWATEPHVQRMLHEEFTRIDARSINIVKRKGTPIRRIYYWTDTWRREGLLYVYGGEVFLFVFGDDRLPGVKVDRGRVVTDAYPHSVNVADWHGACMLQLSSVP